MGFFKKLLKKSADAGSKIGALPQDNKAGFRGHAGALFRGLGTGDVLAPVATNFLDRYQGGGRKNRLIRTIAGIHSPGSAVASTLGNKDSRHALQNKIKKTFGGDKIEAPPVAEAPAVGQTTDDQLLAEQRSREAAEGRSGFFSTITTSPVGLLGRGRLRGRKKLVGE